MKLTEIKFTKETWNKVPVAEQALMTNCAHEVVFSHQGTELVFLPRILENVCDIIRGNRKEFEHTGRHPK